MSSLPLAKADPADAEHYRRRLQRDPNSLLFAEFADRLRRAGDLSDATAICARGLLRHPGYATGHVVMGDIFCDAGHPDRAEREWQEAIDLDPHHPRAHLRLGELYLQQGDSVRADAELRVVLLYNPEADEARALWERAQDAQDPAACEIPEGSAAPGARRRPDWLTADRFEEVVGVVADCPSVDGALLANADGLRLCGGLPGSADPEVGSAAAAALVQEAQELVAAAGAGRLRAAFVRGKEGSLRCLALSRVTLVASLCPEAPVGAADAEIEDALAGLRGDGETEAQDEG